MEASGSNKDFRSVEASGSEDTSVSASSDEADSADSTPAPQTGVPALVSNQPNQQCAKGHYQVYTDAKLPNDKGVMTRTLTLKRRVLTGSLPTMPTIHDY